MISRQPFLNRLCHNLLLLYSADSLTSGAAALAKLLQDIEVYLVYVDADACNGCEECIHYCPVGVFDFFHKADPIRPQNCMGCRTCEAVCKPDAIIVTEL